MYNTSKDEADATFVPGHGDVGTAHDVAAFREYLATLRKLVSEAQASSAKSGEALVDAIIPSLSARYNRWEGFGYLARPNIALTDAELSNRKRIPQASPRP